MKPLILLAAIACCSFAQSTAETSAPPPTIVATIAPQGTDAIKVVTGKAPANTSLVRIDVCNEDTANDHNVSTSRIAAEFEHEEHIPVYSSEVVASVLNVINTRDVFQRAQKAVTSSGNVALVLSQVFKASALSAMALGVGPQIAAALLPVISDPKDIPTLSQKLIQDGTSWSLGKKGSGNDCHTGLAVIASGSQVSIGQITIQ